MKKFMLVALSLLAFTSLPGFAGSKTVVEYGVVQQSQIISSQTRSHPLRTVAAGALGGVVGHQFGNGKGQTAMTAAGAVAGAGVSRHRQSQQQVVPQLELTIKMQSGQLIQVVQQVDGSLTFSQGDKVRVLTSGSNTHVDKSV